MSRIEVNKRRSRRALLKTSLDPRKLSCLTFIDATKGKQKIVKRGPTFEKVNEDGERVSKIETLIGTLIEGTDAEQGKVDQNSNYLAE